MPSSTNGRLKTTTRTYLSTGIQQLSLHQVPHDREAVHAGLALRQRVVRVDGCDRYLFDDEALLLGPPHDLRAELVPRGGQLDGLQRPPREALQPRLRVGRA